MKADEAFAAIARSRVVPVIRASSAATAVAAARAIARGGCGVVEITLTTPDAASAIAALVAEGLVVGAGTVLDAASGEAALAAGAAFLVSPHAPADLLALGRSAERLVVPGALTPSEVLACHLAGAPLVKVFPVASAGGPRYLQLLRDPLPFLRFFPTGGVTLADAPAYLAAGAVALGVGTAIAQPSLVEAGDLDALTARARVWVDAVTTA